VAEQGHCRRQQQRHVKQLQSYLQSRQRRLRRHRHATPPRPWPPPSRPAAAPRKATCCAWPTRSSAPNNNAATVATLEKLLLNYPKKDYWSAYLGRLPRKPGFGDRASSWT
jgi:hypothetical protein